MLNFNSILCNVTFSYFVSYVTFYEKVCGVSVIFMLIFCSFYGNIEQTLSLSWDHNLEEKGL